LSLTAAACLRIGWAWSIHTTLLVLVGGNRDFSAVGASASAPAAACWPRGRRLTPPVAGVRLVGKAIAAREAAGRTKAIARTAAPLRHDTTAAVANAA
jgi:uncharacterized protein YfaA (DUF2138 family)